MSATFTRSKDLGQEATGLFFGGSDLLSANQNYVYFVVRAQDGMAMISQRTNDKPPKALRPTSRTPQSTSRTRTGMRRLR